MQRFELRFLLGGTLLLVIAALALAWQIRVARGEELECLRTAPPPVVGSQTETCPAFGPRLEALETGATFAHIGTTVTPFLLGLFLGVPIVAREVEQRAAGCCSARLRS
jgi:ABC-type nitrate/sulfonate/bicarbonate transport system permease component